MRNWRVLTAIAAVVLAALAGVLVYQYVTNADDRAEKDTEQIEVLVAERQVPKGMTGARALDDDFIGTTEIAREDVPPDTLLPEDADAIRELVAAGTIAEGLPIVQSAFVPAGTAEGFGGIVAKGRQAVTINVDATRGVAGLVAPNDHVNVIVSFEGLRVTAQSGGSPKTTAFLLPGLKVLAVGNTTAAGTNTTEGDDTEAPAVQRNLITVEATPRQAEQLVHAQQYAQVYLTLNPPDFDPKGFTAPEEIVEVVNLFDQPLNVLQGVVSASGQGG